MCDIKTVLVFVALLVAASFIRYRVHTEKKAGQQSKNNIKDPRENEYKSYLLNGECYYLLDEYIVGCRCSRYCRRRQREKFKWSIWRRLFFQKAQKYIFENLTSRNKN